MKIKAYMMYKIASEEGHAHATTKIAIALYNGINNFLIADKKLSMIYFEKASDLGDSEALNYLGLIYEQDNNTFRSDGNKSIKYFKAAYNKGNLDAAFNLSLIHDKNIKSKSNLSNMKNESISIDQDKINNILDKELSNLKINKSVVFSKESINNLNSKDKDLDSKFKISDQKSIDIDLLRESSSKGNSNARHLEKKIKTENFELLEKINQISQSDTMNCQNEKNYENKSVSTKA